MLPGAADGRLEARKQKRRLPCADRRLLVTPNPQTVIVGALSITADPLLNVVLS
jgi:hypothetical protein